MANLLDRFNKQVIGSDSKIYDYLPKIPATGDFKRIKDINVIISSWNNILLTPRGTYLFDPEYGSELYKLVFEPADETTIERIRNEISSRLLLYDDRATILSVDVIAKPNRKGYQINIVIEYDGERGELSVSFDDTTVLTQQGTGGGSPTP